MPRALKELLYGLTFVVGVPALLVAWARATASYVRLHAVHWPVTGWIIVGAGVLLMLTGMRELIVRGRGLPMNAFPPPEFVRSGVFRWLRNPIYIGFGLACAGVSVATASASGLWLVTPVTGLAMLALVHGYERHDLARRFGERALEPALLSIPRGDGAPSLGDRAGVYVWVLIPWLVLYYAVQALGRAPDAFHTQLGAERTWPVWQWTECIYVSVYVLTSLAPFLIETRVELRRFAVRGAVASVMVGLAWIIIPVVAFNRQFEPANLFGRLLAFEQHASQGVAAFPAFHVLWAFITAGALSRNERWMSRRAWSRVAWTWAVLLAISCLTTGMHTVVDVAAAVVLWIPLCNLDGAWSIVRRGTERLANSWREWRVGPVRIINHGVYVALAGGIGFLVAGAAAGRARLDVMVWVAVCVLVGAGLYAQIAEGSSALLRPFGWYGGILGGFFALFTARALGHPLLPLMAGFALAAPWIQIFGRLRCLVQGCCHGGPAPTGVGIVYRHRRSRVTHIAHLAQRPIHATPLYSISGNIVIGVLLVRLRVLAVPDAMLIGVYLMLSGLARFVEESYRAEPQTPTVAGLHSYQWLALLSLLGGMLCTALPGSSVSSGFEWPTAPLYWASLGVALVFGCAMGVDFPSSNRRFSRLAPAD